MRRRDAIDRDVQVLGSARPKQFGLGGDDGKNVGTDQDDQCNAAFDWMPAYTREVIGVLVEKLSFYTTTLLIISSTRLISSVSHPVSIIYPSADLPCAEPSNLVTHSPLGRNLLTDFHNLSILECRC